MKKAVVLLFSIILSTVLYSQADTTSVKIGKKEIVTVIEGNDTMIINIGKKGLKIIESDDGTSTESSEIPLAVTVSLGVSTFPDVAGSELLVAADQALYVAKREGRNRAAFYDSSVKDDSSQVTLNVRFPAASSISEGSYIILTRWFRHRGELTEIEAREISDPGRGLREFAEGPVPPGGPVTAEIRGRVAAVERRGNSTFFSFEVEAEVLNLMFHHLRDREL